jgi:hypothetical protein
MYHRLQFLVTYRVDLQIPGKARLEQLVVEEGECIEARVRPHVIEGADGPIEVADLALPGDGTLMDVPMGFFRFE